MPVNGVSNTQASSLAYVRNDVSASAGELTMTDFYQLLAAQLKYQDADNPMDTSQMMAQMVQTQMIQAITQMTNNNTTTYVASMVGKNVTVKEVDELGRPTGDVTKGDVTGVVLGRDTQPRSLLRLEISRKTSKKEIRIIRVIKATRERSKTARSRWRKGGDGNERIKSNGHIGIKTGAPA